MHRLYPSLILVGTCSSPLVVIIILILTISYLHLVVQFIDAVIFIFCIWVLLRRNTRRFPIQVSLSAIFTGSFIIFADSIQAEPATLPSTYFSRFAQYLVSCNGLWVDKLWFTSLLSGLATSRFVGLESRAFVFLIFFYNPEISRNPIRKFWMQCPEHRKLSTIGHFSWWWPWIQNDDVREFEKCRLKFSKCNPFYPCHPPA